MSGHSLLLELAKARQAELIHEAKRTRISRELKARRKSHPVLQRLQTFLATFS